MSTKCTIPCRYIFAALGSLGMIICYALKVNLSIAIVTMVNHTALRKKDNESSARESGGLILLDDKDDNSIEDGPLLWSFQLQGIIISSYFCGYLFGQLPGARLAEIFSAKWMFYIGTSAHIIGTILIPLASIGHFGLVIVIRILQGIGGGFTFPSAHVLLSKWAPPHERSTITTFIYNGTAIGTVISLLLTGTIASHTNWQASFYIMGGVCIPWMFLWPFLVYDTPQKHRLIKEKELKYLTEVLGEPDDKIKIKVPWGSIMKSIPFYALIIAHFTSTWGWYLVLTGLPLFMSMVLKFKIQKNAILTALPFFTMWIFSIIYGKLADLLIKKNKLSVTWVRKMSTIISTTIPIACLVGMCYAGDDRIISVVLMTISVTAIGTIFSGFMVNHLDLAPNYAGTLMGITNSLATISGIVVPIFVGRLTNKDPTINSWRIIFWITAGLYAFQLITYTIFGSGKEQKWNKGTEPSDNEPNKE